MGAHRPGYVRPPVREDVLIRRAREAELLAAETIAMRQAAFTRGAPFRPMSPAMQRGYYLSAMALGYGRYGAVEQSDESGCYKNRGSIPVPRMPEPLAGWLVARFELLEHGAT